MAVIAERHATATANGATGRMRGSFGEQARCILGVRQVSASATAQLTRPAIADYAGYCRPSAQGLRRITANRHKPIKAPRLRGVVRRVSV